MIVLVDAYHLRPMKEQTRALFLQPVYKQDINCISIISYKAVINLKENAKLHICKVLFTSISFAMVLRFLSSAAPFGLKLL